MELGLADYHSDAELGQRGGSGSRLVQSEKGLGGSVQSEKGLGESFYVELGLADYHSDAELGQRGGSDTDCLDADPVSSRARKG